jgi:ankyrin repeat protein
MPNIINHAMYGDLMKVEECITNGDDINVTDEYGWTALIYASVYVHPAVVTSLIANQADINQTDDYGWSALMNASFYGKVESVKVLIQNQANLLLKTTKDNGNFKKGSSVLDLAYNKNRHNTITELINAPDPDEINELHFYAAKENKEMIQKVITKENDVKKIKQMIEDRDRYGGKPVDINESLEEYFSQLSLNQ